MRLLFPEFRALRYGTSLSGGNLPALKTAIDCGADAVYIGFKDDTNARHFAGLNFSGKSSKMRWITYTTTIKNSYCTQYLRHPNGFERWTNAVDQAADLGLMP